MKLFLLICLVILVAGVLTCTMIECANMQPIQRRPDGIPDGSQNSVTNHVPRPGTNTQVLLIVTNAEYYVEADVESSTNLIDWSTIAHLHFFVPEADGASGSAAWSDGSASGSITATVSSSTGGAIPRIGINPPDLTLPRTIPYCFYRYANFQAWRNEYYTVIVSDGSPY